jgi:hypothetical protein
MHGLINYKDRKAKFRHLKKLTCKGTLRQVFICLRPPPLLRPYTSLTHCIVYTVYSSQSWVENTNMTECISSL